MAVKVVNLTLLKVKEELDAILENYPNQTYKKTLSDPDMCQKLIAYVLNRLPNRHLAIELENTSSISSNLLKFSAQECLNIENLIHQGIYQLNHKDDSPNFYSIYIKQETNYYQSNQFN